MANKRNFIHLFVYVSALLICIQSLKAQEESPMFFSGFQNATIYFLGGKAYKEKVNYDMVQGEFVFLDQNDNNQIKLFTDLSQIGSIHIGERIFLPTRFGPTELIQSEPAVYVQYKPSLIGIGKEAGYGGTSQTSATDTYASTQQTSSSGIFQSVQEGRVFKGEITHIYQIEVNKKKKSFTTSRQFIKIFPKQEKQLSDYINTNVQSFDSIPQVIKLCNYAVSLQK